MHLELPKLPLKSLGDFARHYLMIVLSILTALGLEAWIEHSHHEHAAQAASAQIEQEIRDNLQEVRHALERDTRQAQSLGNIRDALVADFKAQRPDAEIVRHIHTLVPTDRFGFGLNLDWPTLRHEAWDVAVANQSVSWMEPARMRRYTAVYARQRELSSTLSANLALAVDGPRMIDAMTDLRTGQIRPQEFLYVVNQMALMLDQARESLAQLEQRLDEASAAGRTR